MESLIKLAARQMSRTARIILRYSQSHTKDPSQQTVEFEFMSQEQPNNPLHGITLQAMVTKLVDHYGWEQLGRSININSFQNNPSVKSSLKFLRKTDWARTKVENLYLDTFH